MSFKEIEKQKNSQKKENKDIHNSELKNPDQIDIKVLGDHSYFERLDDKMPNRKGISSLNNVLDNTTREENVSINILIVLVLIFPMFACMYIYLCICYLHITLYFMDFFSRLY